jgi:hypothetical protein
LEIKNKKLCFLTIEPPSIGRVPYRPYGNDWHNLCSKSSMFQDFMTLEQAVLSVYVVGRIYGCTVDI